MSETVKNYIIEPRDPSIHRDGKAFDATPGARATSLAFPPPSAVAGALRTLAGNWQGDQNQLKTEARRVREIAVAGPLLVELDEQHAVQQVLFPAPVDAAPLRVEGDEHQIGLRQLRPFDGSSDAQTRMPDELRPVAMVNYTEAKAFSGAPNFWHEAQYRTWLLSPTDTQLAPHELGLGGPTPEQRVHVSVNPNSLTAEEGALFVTQGREYAARSAGAHTKLRRLALLVASAAEIPTGLHPFGGERRLAAFRATKQAFPAPPEEMFQRIADTGRCRVVLLTPACFAAGYKPAWLCSERLGVTATLAAAAVKRPQHASGWNFELNRPKVSRRLAPAGSVYWMTLSGSAASIAAWAEATWMQAVSDEEQDRRDGFGLAALGTWQEG